MPNVLLVDDNVTFARFLRVLLESKLPGVHVTTVDCAEAARESAAQAVPDLAVLDVRLPDGNGHALCEDLARTHPNLQFVMMSAEPVSPSLLREKRIVGVLVKPFASEEVVRMVRHAFPTVSGKDNRRTTPLAQPGVAPAPPTPIKHQLIQLLTGLYDVRQSLRRSDLRECEVQRVIDDKLLPLIEVVSDMSRSLRGSGGTKP